MAIWDEQPVDTYTGPTLGPPPMAPPTPSPIATPPPVQAAPSPAPTQSLPFRIPVLGAILDTGRDLLVGPGNENLTTQEQITRAILNTIVLAKAPQSLGAVYETNQARDKAGMDTLGSPAFRARVTELTNQTPPLSEADAIKQAAREYNVDTGIALPASTAGLPPTDLAEAYRYAGVRQTSQDLANIMTGKLDVAGQPIDDATRMALERKRLGVPSMPGDDLRIKYYEERVGGTIQNPSEVMVEGGQRRSGVTGEPLPPTAGPPPLGSAVVPGGSSAQPSPQPQAAIASTPTPMFPDAQQPDKRVDLNTSPFQPLDAPPGARRLTSAEILAFADRDVPATRVETRLNPATQKEESIEVKLSPEERQHLLDKSISAYNDFNDRIDKAEQASLDTLAKANDEQERVYLQIKMATEDLLRFVVKVDSDGKPILDKNGNVIPIYDVFVNKKPFEKGARGAAESLKSRLSQWLRSTRIGQTFEGNEGISLFLSREGLAAQVLARVITKDRVSEQDWATFAKSLPNLNTPWPQAYKMLQQAPHQFMRALNVMRDREDRMRKDLGQARSAAIGIGSPPRPPSLPQFSPPVPGARPSPGPSAVQDSLEKDNW